ncbi:MAG: hypothetical protein JWM97_2873 [Phycisphaerales bacterium]|nr:hypothetical protein [Phycisphaerales bacterium]
MDVGRARLRARSALEHLDGAPSMAAHLIRRSRNVLSARAPLCSSSRAAYTSVTVPRLAICRNTSTASRLLCSSFQYRRSNCFHLAGSCPNHFRSSGLGRHVLEPEIHRSARLGHSPRPKPLDENPLAVFRGGFVIRPFQMNHGHAFGAMKRGQGRDRGPALWLALVPGGEGVTSRPSYRRSYRRL